MMILSYKAVGTFDRISAVLSLDVVLLVCFLSGIFLFTSDTTLDLVVLLTDDKDRATPID